MTWRERHSLKCDASNPNQAKHLQAYLDRKEEEARWDAQFKPKPRPRRRPRR